MTEYTTNIVQREMGAMPKMPNATAMLGATTAPKPYSTAMMGATTAPKPNATAMLGATAMPNSTAMMGATAMPNTTAMMGATAMPNSTAMMGATAMPNATAMMGANCPNINVFTTQPISLAMAYVPLQQWREVYELAIGFERATIFRELDKPFLGEEAVPNDR